MSLDTCYSLDSDVENYEEEKFFEIPIKAEHLDQCEETDEWSILMSAEDLHYLYHSIRDIIIYGDSV